MNVAWVVLHCNRRIEAREHRQLIPHVGFQVPFLGPESQLKSGFTCAGLLCRAEHDASTATSLIAAFGYTIPNCGVLFLFLGLPVFCFCFVRVFWLLVFFPGRCFLFPVMEWCHLYMHNEPSSLSQHWLLLQ